MALSPLAIFEQDYQLGLHLLLAKDAYLASICFKRMLESPLLCDGALALKRLAACNLGECYILLNNVDKAEYYFRFAIQLQDPAAHYALGKLLEGEGDFRALEHYTQAAKLGNTLAQTRLVTLLGILHTADRCTFLEILQRN